MTTINTAGVYSEVIPHTALNLSIFEVSTQSRPLQKSGALSDKNNPKSAFSSSNNGVYTDRPCGVAIQKIVLPAGSWALVPSTYDPVVANYKLRVWTDLPITITSLSN
jgi:hypothetical protein